MRGRCGPPQGGVGSLGQPTCASLCAQGTDQAGVVGGVELVVVALCGHLAVDVHHGDLPLVSDVSVVRAVFFLGTQQLSDGVERGVEQVLEVLHVLLGQVAVPQLGADVVVEPLQQGVGTSQGTT